MVVPKRSLLTKTVILATGSKSRLLGLPNEQKFLGHGVSYCATCDGNFFKNQIVAVVGGGNTALSDVLYLANLAQKVYLIHRQENFNAEAALVAQIQNQPKIEVIYNAQITGLVGEKHLTDITIQVAANTRQIAVNGLFVAIVRVPENIKFTNVVKLDPAGYIIAGEDCCTVTPGIFVAGDCRTKTVRQLVTAAADGAVSANQAIKWLNKKI